MGLHKQDFLDALLNRRSIALKERFFQAAERGERATDARISSLGIGGEKRPPSRTHPLISRIGIVFLQKFAVQVGILSCLGDACILVAESNVIVAAGIGNPRGAVGFAENICLGLEHDAGIPRGQHVPLQGHLGGIVGKITFLGHKVSCSKVIHNVFGRYDCLSK